MSRPAVTQLERQVVREFRALPYRGYTACAYCGEHANCGGPNAESRVCIGCFEFVFKMKVPNLRRRRK